MNSSAYLEGLTKFGVKLGLENIKKAVGLFQNPQNNYKSIHIGGTNGKGSTAKILSSLLNNFSVGLYTSPHLKKRNERIQVNGKEISDSEFEEYVEKIKKVLEKNNLELTYFEFMTLLAFVYFSDKKVDYALVEVGLGGRFDATNILSPHLCIITNISFDHQKYLGGTLEEIAFEKAGIIKNTTITSETNPKLIKIFKEKKFPVINPSCEVKSLSNSTEKQKIFLKCPELGLNDIIDIKLLGEHQTKNISLALEAFKQLNIQRKPMEIITVFENLFWQGRLQRVKENLFVDGAHNVEGMKQIAKFVKQIQKRDLLIIGIANDKNIDKLLSVICPLFERIIFTKASFKPTPVEKLAEHGEKYCKKFEIVPSVKETIIKTKELHGFSLVTGSFYLVGDFLEELNHKN